MSDLSIPQKRCSKCKQEYPATNEYFSRDKNRTNGLYPHCKKCVKAADEIYRRNNRDKDRERIKKWRRENPDKRNAQKRRQRAKNPEKARAAERRYYRDHSSVILDRCKKYQQQHAEQKRIRQRRWDKKNQHKKNIYTQIYRARKRQLPATLTNAEWEQIKAEWGYRCAYCGKYWWEIDGKLVQEHVIPVPQGGGYTRENIVPACRPCNTKKGGRTPEQAGMKLRERSH